MSVSYKPISWGNEYISSDKLNIMTSNDQYLFERTPTVYYRANGVHKKTGGMKVMAGVQVFAANKKKTSVSKDYQFGTFFSQGCKPVVATSLSMATPGRYHVGVYGLGRASLSPDHRGMNLHVISNSTQPKTMYIASKVAVNFIACGY